MNYNNILQQIRIKLNCYQRDCSKSEWTEAIKVIDQAFKNEGYWAEEVMHVPGGAGMVRISLKKEGNALIAKDCKTEQDIKISLQ